MNISTVAGCIFFLFYFSILSSSSATGETAKPEEQQLEHYAQFYDSMLLPLVEECPEKDDPWNSTFGVEDRFLLEGGKKLCQNVIVLNKLFTNMSKQNQTLKYGKHQPKTLAVNDENDENIPAQIHAHILEHNKVLMDDCSDAWTGELQPIKNDILKIEPTRGNLNEEFREKFGLLVKELARKKNTGKRVKFSSRVIAYKLLAIGKKMGEIFNTNEEQMEWTFQLFAAQLAVYSLRLDWLPTSVPHKKGAILEIAQRWPIGMKPWLKHLGEYTPFYNSMLFPLVNVCPLKDNPWVSSFDFKDRFSLQGEKKLCLYVIGLNELFTTLDIQNQVKGQSKTLAIPDENDGNIPQHGSGNISQQIIDHIRNHNEDVLFIIHDGGRELSNMYLNSIERRISAIKQTKEDLNKALIQNFGQLIKEMEKERNSGLSFEDRSRPTAYELLFIGKRMENVFKSNEAEQMELAFKLFAAQLAVYSLRLDSLPISAPHKKFAIHAIARSWSGMKMETETEKPASEPTVKA